MPSSLKYFGSKPRQMKSSDWKGSGYYYHRGNNNWAKWSRSRDLKKGSKRTVGVGKWKHTNDNKR
jgi:hypothetical protein